MLTAQELAMKIAVIASSAYSDHFPLLNHSLEIGKPSWSAQEDGSHKKLPHIKNFNESANACSQFLTMPKAFQQKSFYEICKENIYQNIISF